jgi:hypothetical protein
MSGVLLNTTTDKLQGAGPAISTGQFVVGFWIIWQSGGGEIWKLANDDVPTGAFLSFEISGAGALQLFSQNGSSDTTNLTADVYKYIRIYRAGDGHIRFAVFPDSTSTTADFVSGDFDVSGDSLSLSLRGFGTAFGNSAPLMTIEAEKTKTGYVWSNAETRTESQTYAHQSGSGTAFSACYLSNTDADSEGLNDTVGSNHFTNTGCVDGTGHPGQLETLGGGPLTLTPTGSETTTESGTATVVYGPGIIYKIRW